jgi:urease accessory protein
MPAKAQFILTALAWLARCGDLPRAVVYGGEMVRILPRMAPAAPLPELERARGKLGLTVLRSADAHVIGDLHQEGCGRLLFPARDTREPLEAVIVNTSGGLTGGDRFQIGVRVRSGAAAVLTTQACEKIYRSSGGAGRISAKLAIETGAILHWLPQETILFDGSVLNRRLDVDMAADARFVAAEAVILGRAAMGERLTTAALRDSWRVRRAGKLVFADETACAGGWERAFASRAALGEGAAAFATLLLVAPDAERKLPIVRDALEPHGIDAGASLVDGALVARMIATDAFVLRRALVAAITAVTGQPPPRVWSM